MRDLVLPAFEMDCRDWLVVTPAEVGLPDELAGAPLLAVLSTAVLDGDRFRSARCVLSVGLLDEDVPARPVADGSVAAELLIADEPADSMSYVLPAPEGRLALLAEFMMADGADVDVVDRVEALMASFRWAA
ncbi:MAG: hypothetical protein JWO57_186 [Pseudonocardiales bacterium]|nr:hypothetical protein [Pseudonocardiales bacterium]